MDFDALTEEGQSYAKMRQELKAALKDSVEGESLWLISATWLRRYDKYIEYDSLTENWTASANLQGNIPGKISNQDFLESDFTIFPQGTGKLEGFESTVFDRHIKTGMTVSKDFRCISKELWGFLSSRYGFDTEVRRYFSKEN